MQQLAHLDASYNGGLAAYITNAKQLLQDSQAGAAHEAQPAQTAVSAFQSLTHRMVPLQARTLLRDIFQKFQMAKEWILAAKSLWITSVKVFSLAGSPVGSSTRL